MPRQELRDSLGHLIGTIETRPDGRSEGRDALGHLCGHYDPRTNETRDGLNRLIGRGNQLPVLVR